MPPDCLLANVQKELNYRLEDEKSSTSDEILRAFCNEEVPDLWCHAERWLKAVSLRTSGGNIQTAD